jgi:hypothetical protein
MYQGRKEIEEGKHVVWYRKFEEDPETAKRGANRLVQRGVVVHNGHVMTCIRNAIDNNLLYMGEKNYLRNMALARHKPRIVAFLESLIDAINRAQTRIEAIDTHLSTDEFARIVYQYQATKIITETHKVNQAAYRLFPKGLAEDPIFQQRMRLSEILQYPERIQRGGGDGESNAPLPEDYVLAGSCPEEDEITHAFLRNVQTCMPDGYLTLRKNDSILYVTPYDVLYILYAGLSFLGETPLNPNVLQLLIARYVIHTDDYDLPEFQTFVRSIVVPLHPKMLLPSSTLDPDRAQTEEQFTHLLARNVYNLPPMRKSLPNNTKDYNASRKGKLANLYTRPSANEPFLRGKTRSKRRKHRNI